jgi:hypothetical protein
MPPLVKGKGKDFSKRDCVPLNTLPFGIFPSFIYFLSISILLFNKLKMINFVKWDFVFLPT